MMYSQARYQQEDYYDDQEDYRQPRGGYYEQFSNPYGYEDDKDLRAPYQSRRPPPRTYDDKAYDEYDDPPRRQSLRAQFDKGEDGDYNYSRRGTPQPQRRPMYDDPPESYQESYNDHDYEHTKRAQPLRRDISYDHPREYPTPRYYRDGYEDDCCDQEDYYHEDRGYKRGTSHKSYNSQSYPSSHYDEDDYYLPQRESTNSQSYNSYPSQAYSPRSYTQNTPPPKKKSIAEHMYERWLNPKPRDPNDKYKTIEEHMCEDMHLKVVCHACKGSHYRYQCQKYPYCERCKAKFSCECGYTHREDDEDSHRPPTKSQGKYGLSEETWALARRLGINIVPDDGMEEDIRVTPRVDQSVHDRREQVSYKAPLEEVIEDVRENEKELQASIQNLEDQIAQLANDGNEGENPRGDIVELTCGNLLNPIGGSTCDHTCLNTLDNNCSKSWADMCEEDNDYDDYGVPNCVDNSNVDCVDNNVNAHSLENINDIHAKFDDHICDNASNSCENVLNDVDDNVLASCENDCWLSNVANTYNACTFNDNDSFDSSNDDDSMESSVGSVVIDMIREATKNEIEPQEEALEEEKLEENVKGKEETIEIEDVLVKKSKETREEGVRDKVEEQMRVDEEELKDERNDKKEKIEESSILLDMENSQPPEESVLQLDFKEFVNARHLRAYLEEKVDGEKGLVPVQVCFNDGLEVESSQGR